METNSTIILLLHSELDYLLTHDFPPLMISSNAVWKLTFLRSLPVLPPGDSWHLWFSCDCWLCAPHKCFYHYFSNTHVKKWHTKDKPTGQEHRRRKYHAKAL